MVTEIAQTYEENTQKLLRLAESTEALVSLTGGSSSRSSAHFWVSSGMSMKGSSMGGPYRGHMSLLMGSGQVAATYGVAGLEATTFRDADLEQGNSANDGWLRP